MNVASISISIASVEIDGRMEGEHNTEREKNAIPTYKNKKNNTYA
jgi:hypothetical protein